MVDLKELLKWLGRTVIGIGILSILLVASAYYLDSEKIWEDIIPFSFLHFWGVWDTMWSKTWDALISYTWIPLLLVFSHSVLVSYLTYNKPEENAKAEALYLGGTKTSLRAGVLEEIFFRWIFFYGYIVFMTMVHEGSVSLLGISIPKLVYDWIFWLPGDMFTLGFLSVVEKEHGWIIAAAMLAANGLFRDSHVHNGLWGMTISWFMGMFFFWITFNYGLVPAIVIHFVYDFIIYSIRYVDMALERSAGRTVPAI